MRRLSAALHEELAKISIRRSARGRHRRCLKRHGHADRVVERDDCRFDPAAQHLQVARRASTARWHSADPFRAWTSCGGDPSSAGAANLPAGAPVSARYACSSAATPATYRIDPASSGAPGRPHRQSLLPPLRSVPPVERPEHVVERDEVHVPVVEHRLADDAGPHAPAPLPLPLFRIQTVEELVGRSDEDAIVQREDRAGRASERLLPDHGAGGKIVRHDASVFERNVDTVGGEGRPTAQRATSRGRSTRRGRRWHAGRARRHCSPHATNHPPFHKSGAEKPPLTAAATVASRPPPARRAPSAWGTKTRPSPAAGAARHGQFSGPPHTRRRRGPRPRAFPCAAARMPSRHRWPPAPQAARRARAGVPRRDPRSPAHAPAHPAAEPAARDPAGRPCARTGAGP